MTLLEAREQKGLLIEEMYLDYQKPIIIVKGNVIGENKNPDYMTFVLKYFNEEINRTYINDIVYKENVLSIDGNYTIYIVAKEGRELKKEMMILEESSIGRLLDIDVYEKTTFSRSDFLKPQRKCLICEKEAFLCIRSQAHKKEEVIKKAQAIVQEFIMNYLFTITDIAIKEEVDLYPKFGLVSIKDSGCHKDMDYQTFIKSKDSLEKGIKQYIESGFNENLDSFKLIEIGVEMEQAMFLATDGINTHKGLIFLLGIFLPVLSHSLYYNKNYDTLQSNIRRLAKKIVGNYYDTIFIKKNLSHSDTIYLDHNIKGIRSEVLNGLEKICRDDDNSDDDYTTKMNDLLYFMSTLNDTTIVHKCNVETLRKVQKETKEMLLQGGFKHNEELVFLMSEKYKKDCISPGGSADMLVLKIIYRKVILYLKDGRR
jgi:holo-ACP synthase/triphosphoribosyl-dephospho-CoA synthase